MSYLQRISVLLFIGLVSTSALVEQAMAQDCVSGSITLQTQSDADNFLDNFAGGNTCVTVEITGNLSIQSSGIVNLDGLAALTRVGGGLFLRFNDDLVSLAGLAALASVGGDLRIQFNEDLTNLDGLDGLAVVGSSFFITDNVGLGNLDGLVTLASVGGNLFIARNDVLTDVDGLAALITVSSNLDILQNLALTDLDGLMMLDSIVGDLSVAENTVLTDCTGLAPVLGGLAVLTDPSLSNVGGAVNIAASNGVGAQSVTDCLSDLATVLKDGFEGPAEDT